MTEFNEEYRLMVRCLDQQLRRDMRSQVLDPSRSDYGGYFSEEWGFASPSHVGNSHYILLLGLAYFCRQSAFYQDPDTAERIRLAAMFQARCQRPSGFIDIPFTNFDSPPDTAFSISQLSAVVQLARRETSSRLAGQIEQWLKPYLLKAADAVAEGGFHTPNHRWNIVEALGRMQELYPNGKYTAAIDAYLNEGIDINGDGEYSERSSGGYNASVNRHLIHASQLLNKPELLEAVRKNLSFMITMMHADDTIYTWTSLRQDRGKRIVPYKAVDSFYYMAKIDGGGPFALTARKLLKHVSHLNTHLLEWFMLYPQWQSERLPEGGALASDQACWMPSSGIWKARQGSFDVTAARGIAEALTVKFGQAELIFKLHAPYFAGALFKCTDLKQQDSNSIVLTYSSDMLLEQLPGYWLPTNAPVPYEALPYYALDARKVIPRPRLEFQLEAKVADFGVNLRVRSQRGMPHVPVVLECWFNAPGQLDTGEISLPAQAGQSLLLKAGRLTYRIGQDAITIGPGSYGHRMTDTPIADGSGERFRVVMTDWTPVDRELQIRCGAYSEAEGACHSAKGPVAAGLSNNGGTTTDDNNHV